MDPDKLSTKEYVLIKVFELTSSQRTEIAQLEEKHAVATKRAEKANERAQDAEQNLNRKNLVDDNKLRFLNNIRDFTSCIRNFGFNSVIFCSNNSFFPFDFWSDLITLSRTANSGWPQKYPLFFCQNSIRQYQ